MKISTANNEVPHFTRNPDQCVLQVNGVTLKQVEKFKYLGVGVALTSEGMQDKELDTQIGKITAVMRALHFSIVIKRELWIKAKLSIFKTVFVSILTIHTALAKANGRRPVGRPRTRWINYITDLGWNRLGLHPSEMMDVMEDHDMC